MSTRLNVDGSADEYYRYKMDALVIVRQNRQRILQNLSKVSKDVGRTPELIVAYFECEFLRPSGISGCHIDDKGHAIVPEGVDQSVLQSALHALIQQHVLCRRCRNPETTVVGLDDEHHTTILRCSACGTSAGSADKASPSFYQWLQQPHNRKHWVHDDSFLVPQPFPDPYFPPTPKGDDVVSSGGWYVSPQSDATDSPSAGAVEPSD
jgi:translation initiation factor 2 beta subunit (eIF-2beta)/eIF-5